MFLVFETVEVVEASQFNTNYSLKLSKYNKIALLNNTIGNESIAKDYGNQITFAKIKWKQNFKINS